MNPQDSNAYEKQVQLIVRSLTAEFGTHVNRAQIRAKVELEYAAHSDARVIEFVALLVERRVRSQLRQCAAARQATEPTDSGT